MEALDQFVVIMTMLMLTIFFTKFQQTESRSSDARPPTLKMSPFLVGKKARVCCSSASIDNKEANLKLTVTPNDDPNPLKDVTIILPHGGAELCNVVTAQFVHHQTTAICESQYYFSSGPRLLHTRKKIYAFKLATPVVSGPTTLASGDSGIWNCEVPLVTVDDRQDFSLSWRLDGDVVDTETTSATFKGFVSGIPERTRRYSFSSSLRHTVTGSAGRNTSRTLACVAWHRGLQVSERQDKRTVVASLNLLVLGAPGTITAAATATATPPKGDSTTRGRSIVNGTEGGSARGKASSVAATIATRARASREVSTMGFAAFGGQSSKLSVLFLTAGASFVVCLLVMAVLVLVYNRRRRSKMMKKEKEKEEEEQKKKTMLPNSLKNRNPASAPTMPNSGGKSSFRPMPEDDASTSVAAEDSSVAGDATSTATATDFSEGSSYAASSAVPSVASSAMSVSTAPKGRV